MTGRNFTRFSWTAFAAFVVVAGFSLAWFFVRSAEATEHEAENSGSFAFGPWVEHRHRNDGVFQRFNAALMWVDPSNVEQILGEARQSGTQLFLQLGSGEDVGWNPKTRKSDFTLSRFKSSVDRFGTSQSLHAAISGAIADGTVRGIYLMDEPHHPRWSPNNDSYTHISNADLDLMAAHVKSYWPSARTSVRSSARTLFAYGRDSVQWKHLDECFIMVNYRKWKKHGDRTLEGFMEREFREAHNQGLGVVGSIQMLHGAPESAREFWPLGTGAHPVGKLSVSPVEMELYLEAFLTPRNDEGAAHGDGTRRVDAIMVFRWDRNDEDDWESPHYDEALSRLIQRTERLR